MWHGLLLVEISLVWGGWHEKKFSSQDTRTNLDESEHGNKSDLDKIPHH